MIGDLLTEAELKMEMAAAAQADWVFDTVDPSASHCLERVVGSDHTESSQSTVSQGVSRRVSRRARQF